MSFPEDLVLPEDQSMTSIARATIFRLAGRRPPVIAAEAS